MTSPLEGALAKTIGAAFSGLFLDATLTRAATAAGPNAWTPGAVTTTVYACKAIHEAWSTGLLAQGLVEADDVKVLILASSIAIEPAPGDMITIRGEQFTIIIIPAGGGKAMKPAVSTDPAKAVWEIRARR
jgi:hypothetical protein